MIDFFPSEYPCPSIHKDNPVKQHISLLEKRQKELRKELQLLLDVIEDLQYFENKCG